MRSVALHVTHPLLDIVVVEEGHEVTRGVTMRAGDLPLDPPPLLEHRIEPGGTGETLDDGWQSEVKRVVERGVDPDHVVGVAGRAPDELGDVLLRLSIEDLAEGEEILLADSLGEFPHRAAEEPGSAAMQVAQRVNAKPVDVPS